MTYDIGTLYDIYRILHDIGPTYEMLLGSDNNFFRLDLGVRKPHRILYLTAIFACEFAYMYTCIRLV